MADPETTGGGPGQPGDDDNWRRDPWWHYIFDSLMYCGEGVVWLIGGILRAFAWMAAAVLSSCN